MTTDADSLLQLVLTAVRETSPQSAPAFDPDRDLPRVYQHLRAGLEALGYESKGPGGPAVLQIPEPPENLTPFEQECWIKGWYAGYTSAWRMPPTILTDTEY